MEEGEERTGPHGALPPDGRGIWHLVHAPLDPRAACGLDLLYGSRLRPWVEIPAGDRCDVCHGLDAGPSFLRN